MVGISDMIAASIFKVLIKYFTSKKILLFSYLALALMAFTFTIISWIKTELNDSDKLVLSSCIFAMRFFASLSFVAVYFANNEYFPALLKGGIFAITNVAARVTGVMSPIIADGVSNPAITIAIASLISLASTIMLKNPKEEQILKEKSD